MSKSEDKENFIHLHVHNSFSFKDGLGSPQSRVEHALKTGKKAVATSNHGNIADWIGIYNACKEHNLKPILGCEFYFNRYAKEFRKVLQSNEKEDVQKRKELRKFNRHFTAFAKNSIGYKNIIKIHNDAWMNGFYHVPITSPEMIKHNSEGIIATSGCASSELNVLTSKKQHILSDERPKEIDDIIKQKVKLMKSIFRTKNLTKYYENEHLTDFEINYFSLHRDESFNEEEFTKELKEYIVNQDKEFIKTLDEEIDAIIDWWLEIFGDNYYIELMTIDYPVQKSINEELIKISQRRNIPVILTNDVHYISKTDSGVQAVMMLSDQRKTFEDLEKGNAWTIKSRDFYHKTVDELYESWERLHKSDVFNEDIFWKAIHNVGELVDSVEEFEIDKSSKLPRLYGEKSEKMLVKKIHDGMKKKNLIGKKEYEDRIKFELKIIKKKGFIDYFLIMDDIIHWAKENYGKYSVGPGRGCFVPNSKVKISDGSYKNIEDLEKNDEVISGWGNIRKVKNKFKYSVNEKLTKIKVGSDIIECTNDHKILVIPKGKEKDLKFAEWKEASKIEKGDILIKNYDKK